MLRNRLPLSLLVVATLSAAADTPSSSPAKDSSRVTLALSEYERLHRLDEHASVTVVDILRLGGSFRSRGLTVSFSGRSSGKLPAEAVLSADEGIFVYDCAGDGIVSRSDEGFTLTPLAAKFDVKCRLALRGTDRLELKLPRSVLWIESTVSDGELVAGPSSEGVRSVSVVRRTGPGREALPPSATGRYRITLLPDETRFRYEIDARNPNRSRQTFDVVLRSDEHVLQVDAAVPYEVDRSRYRFELPPGDTKLTMTGTLSGHTFTLPVEAAVQYALLDSHPLLLATLSGPRKRVSPDEVGIPAEFRGAQAFILAKDEKLDWDVTRLEALRTTSFAVKRESHVLFIAAGGPSLGESAFVIDNQGASEVTVPVKPEPTFASFGGEPILLTKNKDGDLRLPLGRGAQELLIQHRQALARSLGIARGTLLLPRLSAPASRASVEVRYPAEWIPLLEGFASEDHFHLPGRGSVLLAAFVLFLTQRALALLGLSFKRSLTAAILLTLAAVLWRDALWAILVADLAVVLLVLIGPLRRIEWTGRRVALAIVGAVVAGIAVLVYSASAPMASKREYDGDVSSSFRAAQTKNAVSVASPNESVGPSAVAGELHAYQGLPAKFELPAGSSRSFFTREMLSADGPREVRILAISKKFAFWVAATIALAAAFSLARIRREIVSGWKARLAEALPASPKPTGVNP
jgi:hypothetical protein